MEPRIRGTPTNIVGFNGKVYVTHRGNRTVHCYGGSEWQSLQGPDNKIIWELAATSGGLYALVSGAYEVDDHDVYRMNSSGEWTALKMDDSAGDYRNIQTIYGAGSALFVGARRGNSLDYAVFSAGDGSANLTPLTKDAASRESPFGLLRGAAFDGSYYLAISGEPGMTRGIFLADSSAGLGDEPEPGTENQNVVGIIALQGGIAAAAKTGGGAGHLLIKTAQGFQTYTGYANFTGAMSLWEKADAPDALLLLGIQGNSINDHGYRELVLPGKNLPGGKPELRNPGGTNSSTENYDKYSASLGTHPVQSIFQVRGADSGADESLVFAATSKDGLWSYRDGRWTAEP